MSLILLVAGFGHASAGNMRNACLSCIDGRSLVCHGLNDQNFGYALSLFAQEATHYSACLAEESASESVLVCVECGIFTNSAANFEGHERGAKHAARLELTEGLHSPPAWCRGCCTALWQSPAPAVAYGIPDLGWNQALRARSALTYMEGLRGPMSVGITLGAMPADIYWYCDSCDVHYEEFDDFQVRSKK